MDSLYLIPFFTQQKVAPWLRMGQKMGGFDNGKRKTIQSCLEVKVWSGQPAGTRWQQMGVDGVEMLVKEEETRTGMKGALCQGSSRQWDDQRDDFGYVKGLNHSFLLQTFVEYLLWVRPCA